ncbi:MAG: hypothetical protein RL211_1951 [Pseudomonadota bacterium]
MTSAAPSFWKDRFRASGLHLGISLVLAAFAGALVFGLWYPFPYREISGGRELFWLLVSVDVVLGPLITLAIFDRRKPGRELVRDLALVGLIQLAALGYGLWSVFVARPVYLVFEYSRFVVVHAVDVPQELLGQAPPGLQSLPLTGPGLLSLRPFKDEAERMSATFAALQGAALSARTDFWQSYAAGAADVLRVARPVAELRARFAHRAAVIDGALAGLGREAGGLVYVPMVSRQLSWTVLLEPGSAQVLGFLPVDSF